MIKLHLIGRWLHNWLFIRLSYSYSKEHYKVIAIDLSKQQALDADLKAIQQINFTGNLAQDGNTTIFFITEEAKETILDFSEGTVKVLWIYFNIRSILNDST